MASPQEEFTHPVIQAMQNAYEQIQKTKATKFNQDLETRKADLEQQAFQELQKQHDLGERHANEQHDINLQTLEMARRQHSLDQSKAIQEFIASGGKAVPAPDLQFPDLMNALGKVGPDLSIPQLGKQMIPNTDVTFDPRGYSTPEEIQQRQIQGATQLEGARTTAQGQAEEPFKIAADKRNQENRLKEIQLQGQNALTVENRRRQNEIELENMRGHFQLEAARIAHQHGNEAMAPVFSNAFDSILNGQAGYSALPKDLKEGVSALAAAKGWQLPTNQKTYADNLTTASGVQNLINQYRDLAINDSRDSEGTGMLGKASAFLTGGGALPGTDLRSKLDSMKANGGALASFFDKQNRKSDAEILRQVVGLFDPRATMKENLDKIEQHKSQLATGVRSIFAGMPPEQVKYILNGHGLTDLGDFEPEDHKSTKGRTAIKLEDGTIIPDTPQNRQLHGLK